ncbi:MAG: acyl-CoA thioesterase [Bryobacteraceae bacterium]|nr:acyl-CoA thioesterase [Bryobacteraceae bacterium]
MRGIIAFVPLADKSQVRFRVRYAETDQMRVVYHANYLVWFEMARTELCRIRGVRYRDMERDDQIRLAVVDAHCRYHAPALYDDEIISEGRIAEVNPRMLTFAYEIRNAETGRLLVTGETKHVFLDATGRPIRVPEKYRDLFGMDD